MLTAMLQAFDASNPLSEIAVGKLVAFQAKVPPVAYTTAQMRISAEKGIIGAMIMEAQAYKISSDLTNYVFTPFGVRHDSPVYALNSIINEEQKNVLQLFIDYCKTSEAQTEAVRYGFNDNNQYSGEEISMNGAQLFAAQKVWKENKDAGQPVIAVFIADVSGSMDGTALNELKKSLLNAFQYIGEDNYIGLISYADNVHINLPIAEFDGQQQAKFAGAVKNLAAGGSTATYNAVLVSLKMLLEKRAEVSNARVMCFVLSDGKANKGYSLSEKMIALIDALNIPIHTIGYNADLSELSRLSMINEASSTNADESNVVYNLKNIFNSQI
jgi:Ca-activated chloride channel family protein